MLHGWHCWHARTEFFHTNLTGVIADKEQVNSCHQFRNSFTIYIVVYQLHTYRGVKKKKKRKNFPLLDYLFFAYLPDFCASDNQKNIYNTKITQENRSLHLLRGKKASTPPHIGESRVQCG